MINTVKATEVITAAWVVYQTHGFCNRSHREIVNDGIMVGEGDDAKFVPSLYSTVVANIPDGTDAAIVLDITTEIRQQAEANRDLILQTALFKFMQDQLDDFTKGVYNDLNKEEILVVGKEIKAVWIKRHFPALFGRIIRKQIPE